MYRQLPLLLILALLSTCQEPSNDSTAEETAPVKNDLTFTNPTETSVANQGVTFPIPEEPSPFLLRDGNRFLPYQLDDLDGDGKAETVFTLLDFTPEQSKTLALMAGKPDFPTQIQVQQTKQQLIWENNRVAFQFDLGNSSRYSILGKKEEALHNTDKGKAIETILKSGNNLGLGSPGILLSKSNYPEIVRDSLATFKQYESKDVQILISGPLRTIFRITYKGLRIGRDALDLAIDHEMHAAHRWTDVTINILKTTNNNLTFATGVVKHPGAFNFVTGPTGAIFFGYSWGKQSIDGENMGMAVLAPTSQQVRSIEGGFLDSHVILMQPVNGKVHYRFIGSWEPGPFGFTANPLFLKYIQRVAAQMSF